MALSDCIKCWMTPCECGYEFENASDSYKAQMTKSINGFTIEELMRWLENKHYLNYDNAILLNEFKEEMKVPKLGDPF